MRNMADWTSLKDGTSAVEIGQWDDLRFPATGINPPGADSDPTRSTTDGLLEFSASATNILVGVAQMPHSWESGTDIRPHIHWYVTNESAGDVLWRFEYKLFNGYLGEIPGSFETANNLVSLPANSNGMAMIDTFGSIDMGGITLSGIILWKLSRIGDDLTDTYPGVARLIEVDFHYKSDSIGSGQEFLKASKLL